MIEDALKCANPSCGATLEPQGRFCPRCRTPVPQSRKIACPMCGRVQSTIDPYCSYCGAGMGSLRGLPMDAAQAWREFFVQLGFWHPTNPFFAKRPDQWGFADTGIAGRGPALKAHAAISAAGFPLPDRDPLDPWILRWACGDKSAKHARLAYVEWIDPESSSRLGGASSADGGNFLLTRCRIAVGGGSRTGLAPFKVLGYPLTYVESARVVGASLVIRPVVGPVIVASWETLGSAGLLTRASALAMALSNDPTVRLQSTALSYGIAAGDVEAQSRAADFGGLMSILAAQVMAVADAYKESQVGSAVPLPPPP